MKNQYREQIQIIRADMIHGRITIEQAKEQAQPVIDEMNKRAEEIAKEFGKKPVKFTFNGVMR